MSDTPAKPHFDSTLTLGNILTILTMLGGGVMALWTVAGQFQEVKYQIERVATTLNLTVNRLDERDKSHDERIKMIERRMYRGLDPS